MILLIIEDETRFLANDSYLYKESALTILSSGTFSLSREFSDIPMLLRTPVIQYSLLSFIKYLVIEISLIMSNIILLPSIIFVIKF